MHEWVNTLRLTQPGETSSTFHHQRQLYQRKFTEFWLTTVDDVKNNPRALWRFINQLLQPRTDVTTPTLSADDFATHFRHKVVSRAMANSAPPVITARSATPLRSFEPVTEQEISKLLSTSPSKSCCLDPIPTWLLKRISAHIAPIICYL